MSWQDYCDSDIHVRIDNFLKEHELGLASTYSRDKLVCYIAIRHTLENWDYYDCDVDKIIPETEFNYTNNLEAELMEFAKKAVEIYQSPLFKVMRED
jgi:hypothetical protein